MENGAYIQAAGLKWMFEMELFLDPERSKAMINALKLNVLSQSKRIRECEFLIHREGRQMLVLLELSWMGRKFFKKQIIADVYEVLNQLLPTFKFRVTDDPKIMEMSVDRLKKALEGGNDNEVPSDSVKPVDQRPSTNNDNPGAQSSSVDSGTAPSPEANQEEQQQSGRIIFDPASSGDSSGQS